MNVKLRIDIIARPERCTDGSDEKEDDSNLSDITVSDVDVC